MGPNIRLLFLEFARRTDFGSKHPVHNIRPVENLLSRLLIVTR